MGYMKLARRLVCLAIGAGLMALWLAACGESGITYNTQSTPIPIPSSASAPGNPAADLYYAQKTQEAAGLVLTSQAGVATRALQQTESMIHLTQVALNVQLTSSAATATQARAYTQDAQTAAAATSTQSRAYSQDTATAQVATQARAAAVAQATTDGNSTQTAATAAASATAAQGSLDAQTQEVTTWGPIVFVIVVAISVIVFGWRLMGIFETRKRVIPQPNGAPLIISEQRGSLEEHLPNFLRWLAWFLETRQVIVDQERNMYPVTVLHGGWANSPKLTDDDRQERVTRRRQFTEAVAAVAVSAESGETSPREVAHQLASLALSGEGASGEPVEVTEAPDTGQVTQWLDDVERRLLNDGERS